MNGSRYIELKRESKGDSPKKELSWKREFSTLGERKLSGLSILGF
jgi:hypothetical protein